MSPPVHLLLDLENVQPSADELRLVRGGHFRLWVLHGPHQKHFTAELVSAWQPLGEQVRFVQSAKQGKNALDLHLAFCMGEAAERDRAEGVRGCYIVVSKDQDFDALFGYLDRCEVMADRATTLADAISIANERVKGVSRRIVQVEKPLSPDAARILEQFRAHPKNRPKTQERLCNHVGSFLAKDPAAEEVLRVVAELKGRGIVSLEATGVRYCTPPRQPVAETAA